MRQKRILVINPNSNESVTLGLQRSIHQTPDSVQVDFCTLQDGPFGIESDADIARVEPLVAARVQAETRRDAFVIACYSDPGLALCRQRVAKPVFGMQQSALETAAGNNRRFGVLALSDESIRRHLIYIEKLGFTAQLAAELALDISVDQAANDPGTLNKITSRGRELIDQFGAEVLVLGCAGMAAYRQPAEDLLKVPVVEPTQAALNLAIEAA